MKVSVVVLAYNEEKNIKRCIESILTQTKKADEIIIVNNNSTDNTLKILKEFKDIVIVNEKTKGITPARNSGFNKAQYDIIARVDADTQIQKDWIAIIHSTFSSKKYDAISGPSYFNDVPDNIYYRTMSMIYSKGAGILLYPFFFDMDTLLGFNMAITKKAWHNIKDSVCGDDKKVHEDLDLSIHLLENKARIEIIPALRVGTSGRRMIDNPQSYYLEYPLRVFKTILRHI